MSDITLPQLGETVTEGTITRWFKQVGDAIAEDDVLFEVSTDKVDSEVPSPVSGVLTEILVAEGDTVDVGSVLARVGDGDPAAPAESKTPAAVEQEPVSDTARAAELEPSVEPARVVDAARPNDGHGAAGDVEPVVLSPVVRKLVAENNLDPSSITGSGAGGRITRRDVEAAIAASPTIAASAPRPPAESTARPTAPAQSSAGPQGSGRPASQKRGERVAFSNIRRLTGAHMVGSKSTSPHVLTAVEVDYERVDQVRSVHKAAFKAEEGFSLTYLPFIARALIDALEEFPRLNASVDADALTVHADINLAIAVDLDFEGLLAPVVRDADTKRLRAIAVEVRDLADRAHAKQLSPDELSDGTFTITNAGSYGTMMQFPVINQPQVAILSTDGISRKPVVVNDEFGNESIAIHSVGVLALAWDHRAFDGAYAAAFLNRLREIIETHDWEAEL
jgi:pyruvate dehydrogenase E2 component (dihydrolipoamide acetyltransferase)